MSAENIAFFLGLGNAAACAFLTLKAAKHQSSYYAAWAGANAFLALWWLLKGVSA